MKPSSAIALVSSMLGAATPPAFFFSQPVTNVAARMQSNVDARAFEVFIFMGISPFHFDKRARKAESSRAWGGRELLLLLVAPIKICGGRMTHIEILSGWV